MQNDLPARFSTTKDTATEPLRMASMASLIWSSASWRNTESVCVEKKMKRAKRSSAQTRTPTTKKECALDKGGLCFSCSTHGGLSVSDRVILRQLRAEGA